MASKTTFLRRAALASLVLAATATPALAQDLDPAAEAAIGRGFVTLKFDNADVREVLGVIGRRAELDIVLADDVRGRFNVDVRTVPLGEFFRTVLRSNGLTARRVGASILIAKASPNSHGGIL